MILIFPKKIDSGTDYNYKLAEYLKKYIQERGGTAEISRKSSDAPEIEPLVCQKTVNPDIFLGLYTGDYTGGTYIIVCDAYSALAGTWNYLCKNTFGDPTTSDNAGLDISGNLTLSKENDVILHLPAIISEYTDIQLEDLSKQLVEEAYWYPIYTKDDKDVPNIKDPYLYRFSSSNTWHEETYEFKTVSNEESDSYTSSSSGKIGLDDKDAENHPIHYLEIQSKETGNYPSDPTITPPEPEIPRHYVWSIPLVDIPITAKKIIFSAKGTSGGEKIYVKIGKKQAQYEATPSNYQEWTTDIATTLYKKFSEHTIALTSNLLESLELGVIGTGTVRFTGIWITDTEDNYYMLPYPYRKDYTEDEIEVQTKVPEEPCITLTKATSLDDRAKDKIAAPEPEQEEATAEDPGGGASTATAAGFGAVTGKLTSLLDGSTAITDLTSLMKIDTKALEDKLNSALDFGEKLSFSKTKDKLDGMKNGALSQAAEIEKVAQDKVAALNSNMSLDNLKGSFKLQMPKIPTPETTAGITDLANKAKNNIENVKNGVTDLTSGLDKLTKQASVSLGNATSQLSAIQNMTNQAKDAVSSALASTKSKLPSTGGISL